MSANKVAILGGGSAYIPGILYSFVQSKRAFAGGEVCLMDVDKKNLPVMHGLGTRMAREGGAKFRITTTTSLKKALDGASFVLTNYRPGGHAALKHDEKIPLKHGILGSETLGPGGTFYALRSIPQVLSLCRTMSCLSKIPPQLTPILPVMILSIPERGRFESPLLKPDGGDCLDCLRQDLPLAW